MIYRLLFTLVLQRIPPETAHLIAAWIARALGAIPGFDGAVHRRLAPADPCLAVDALGLRFPSPLGVAAGLDKNITWLEELGALGFGFVEVGTVTALRQSGNPKPRVHRLTADRALINSMGFPNRGASAAARRLRRRSGTTIVAVNVGRSKLASDAAADYRQTVRKVAPFADLLVLNVSSPNTPGLRDMQDVARLTALVAEVRAELAQLDLRVPLLIKISPDLCDDEIDAIARLALHLRLDGVVAVNSTTARAALKSRAALVDEAGGLSGAPLGGRALEVLRLLSARTAGEIVLVSVGGIETADDVLERLRAGASLVAAYSGFVYGGPLWPHRLNRDLAARVRALGASSLRELVDADGRTGGRSAAKR